MEKIAIIGLSCLLPGAETPEQYWQNIIEEKYLTSKATAEQLGIDAQFFYDPIKGKTDKYYCLNGGYIRDFQFDASGYQIPYELLKDLDKIYQWSLYVSKQALQDSGYLGNTAALAQCGVILGNLSFPTRLSHHLFAPIYQKTLESAVQTLLKNDDFRLNSLAREVSPFNALISGYPATLIAQSLSLSGPRLSLDAACASSLYAVKLACQYLSSGKADLMLAGAVSGADPLFIKMGFSIFQAYPENGKSCPFDKSSGGLFAGEGAGILVLKRYHDAIRDGDNIYATIGGIGLSNDGRGKFVLNPNPKGQLLAFERTYRDIDIDPNEIYYIECHATGTPVGDIAELNSMEAFFGKYQNLPLIGSVKSNFGHLLTTAGMASLIKVILSMKEGTIPATINLTEPLSSDKGVFSAEQMVRTTTRWPQEIHTKRAAVSAFGFGGTNAHLILESEPTEKEKESNLRATTRDCPYEPPLCRGNPLWLPSQKSYAGAWEPEEKLAIIGMEVFFGGCHNLDEFDRTIYDGTQHFIPVPPQRWQGIDAQNELLKNYGFEQAPLGAYIQDFAMDFLHFKIPPREEDQLIPQQLLMLKVADNAIKNAGLVEGGNVAVIVAMGTELALHQFRGRCDLSWQIKDSLAQANIVLSPDKTEELEAIAKNSLFPPAQLNQYTSFIGNIMACRIAAQWDFTGPTFTVSAEENAVFSALEVAQQFLATGEVDAVVLGAVDLAGGFESMLLRHQLAPINSGVNTLSYDEKANGWMVGEGAGAVVLKRVDTAQTAQDRIYAVIDAISLMPSKADSLEHLPKTPTAETVTQSCQQAFDLAGIKATDIGYMEVFGSGVAQEDEAEIKGLTNAYQNDSLTTAIGSVKANIGHTYAASGMASLIKTALCLYHRYIPAVPKWENTKKPEQWQGSPFYVATESKTWFLEEGESKRVAAINGLGLDGTYAHLILSEDQSSRRIEAELDKYRQQTAFYLFPLAAENQSALLKQLNELQNTIENSDNLGATASQTFATFQNQPEANYRLSIVGHHKNELRQQIGFAMPGIKKAFATGKEWKTPLGSYFTAKPLEKVAFVYPGMGSTYIGVGRELFRLYPKIDATFSTLSNHIGKLINDKLLYPRCLEKLSTESQQALETQLSNNGVAMCQTGISFDVLHTAILREYFKIQPQAAFGYSQGELSGMMYALGVWRDNKMLSEDLASSPLYQTQLTGPCFTARKLWGLPLDWNNPPTENFWCSYVLRATATAVKEILKHEERVYLTFINTPEDVIIGGDPDGCLRVIETLKCKHSLINFNSVCHCEVTKSEYEALANLHTVPVHKVADITFYSATDCAPMPFNTHYMGHNAAKMHGQTLDFSAITNHVYEDGARIFIELGAGNNCARWIDETLKGKEHVAMSINTKGVDDQTGIIKMLAKLVSHRVSMDLSPLYPTLAKDSKHSKKRKSLIKKITLGGQPIHTTILTDENRKSFENQIISHSPMLKIIQLQIAVYQQSHNDPLSVQANSSHRQPTLVTAPPSLQKPVIDLNAEVVLDSTIQPKNTPWAPVTEPRSIFLTGATGFLGTFLLYELLHQTQADIYCLVRSPNVHFGQMRIQNNLASYFSLNEDFHSRIVPVLGDLSKPLLGLSSEQFQRMANQIDTIYHCAAWLNWVAPYSQLKTINVLGTQEILRLAAQVKIKPVHYISTVAVFESSAYYQQVVTESDALVHSEEIYLGYSQSKWVAEKLVMVARDRGFPVCIYRPPLISGHSQTGVWNTDDVTCKIIKGCIQMGHVPEFNYLFDVSPVDYVSRAIVYLSKQPEALGKAFHLNNPNPLHHNQFIDFINSFGYPLRQIPYENWLTLLNQDTAGLPENPVAPLLPFFAEKWSETQITIPQVYEITRKPQLSYQNTLAKLVGTSIVCPPVDAKLLHTYFSYFIRSGFLDAPTKSPDKSRAILHTVTGDVSEKNPLLKGDLGGGKQVLWDEADLLEFAEGKIANVFGPEYAIIDSYSRRVRLPTPPYLLVSRVTKLNAEKGSFKPCTLTTEYDIPHNMWYLVDGQIPWAVSVESGQCDLLLISYLGIDFDNKGVLVYRLLDCTMTFLEDIPTEGDTLRYDISINSFVKHGNNLLFFFSYECFVGDKMVLTMEGGCAGFFTDDELDKGKGVVYSKKELIEREKIQKQQFEPLLICQKSSFDETDMIHMTEGNLAACFGDHYWQAGLNPSLRIPPKDILMIDRVTSVEFNGGAYGLGLLVGEKVLEPDHWYFPCHFKDDQVMAGSLMAEGCGQLLLFYILYLGFQTCTTDARFQPIPNLRQVVRCRGQVTPISATLIYRLEITELGLTPKPYAKGDVEIILNGKIVVHFKDVGLQLSEKNPANSLPVGDSKEPLASLVKLPSESALLNEEQIQEFCLGSVGKCFGPEFDIYDTGEITASRMPNTHLNFVHRVLEVKGKRHQLTKHSTIVTEYDAPVETWYYHHNSSNTLPYSIFMEIALQPCGFLAAYLGTTLLYPDESLYFRNLDGRGRIIKNVDIRGKTVTNTARLLSTSNIQGMIIQSFDFEMVCDGEPFYQGDASFGFFSSNALANQVGLDRGKDVRPWIENTSGLPITKIDFRTPENRASFYLMNAGLPHYRLAQHQLDLLNEVKIVQGGGRYQQGYIYARKKVKPTDWYFKCHFHQDPVMPGSLGVEAILQAMQVYALQLDLGKHLKSPRFGQVIDHEIVWKYRGQIPQPDVHTEMYLEVHLSKVEIGKDKVTLIGDASLWKPNLRIYEVKNVTVCLLESQFMKVSNNNAKFRK